MLLLLLLLLLAGCSDVMATTTIGTNMASLSLPLSLFFFSISLFLSLSQESPQDSAITRDINRTFPAHDYFKDTGGDGQDSLYKICKVRTCTHTRTHTHTHTFTLSHNVTL